jgi:hypothetical protein
VTVFLFGLLEKKYATFPSGSIGWRIDQEDFMKGSSGISELKLRAGYGIYRS